MDDVADIVGLLMVLTNVMTGRRVLTALVCRVSHHSHKRIRFWRFVACALRLLKAIVIRRVTRHRRRDVRLGRSAER
ncbi:hypothetical protein C0Z19_00875 [Trinickia soli]|uniref:Uncharacterized protein n=1 Tax=Trinickia soli TaxID=380675 RepID=A0A2N7WFS1_9BURK|nr:hypothetical protein C0Z19_00875 [Trinickia soli]